MANKLTDLPNIGETLAKNLNDVGIKSFEDLKKTGSIDALKKIRTKLDTGCLSMLYALEGAIRGIRWHDLPQKVRDELKEKLAKL